MALQGAAAPRWRARQGGQHLTTSEIRTAIPGILACAEKHSP